jgi:hypothetical protein
VVEPKGRRKRRPATYPQGQRAGAAVGETRRARDDADDAEMASASRPNQTPSTANRAGPLGDL